jgi:hypothetical protein
MGNYVFCKAASILRAAALRQSDQLEPSISPRALQERVQKTALIPSKEWQISLIGSEIGGGIRHVLSVPEPEETHPLEAFGKTRSKSTPPENTQ